MAFEDEYEGPIREEETGDRRQEIEGGEETGGFTESVPKKEPEVVKEREDKPRIETYHRTKKEPLTIAKIIGILFFFLIICAGAFAIWYFFLGGSDALESPLERCVQDHISWSIMAVLDDDLKHCEQEENDEDLAECIHDYHIMHSIRNNDFSECSATGNQHLATACEVVVNEDESKCSLFEGEEEAYCMAVITKNTSYCKEVATDSEQVFCKDDVVLIDAFKQKDKSKCEAIIMEDYENLCINLIDGGKQNYIDFLTKYCERRVEEGYVVGDEE